MSTKVIVESSVVRVIGGVAGTKALLAAPDMA
jgi:hypothetical protein